jgi:hypothetical protein
LKRCHADTPSLAAQRALRAGSRRNIAGVSVPAKLWTIQIDTSKILSASLQYLEGIKWNFDICAIS